jgi:hypothetical protein
MDQLIKLIMEGSREVLGESVRLRDLYGGDIERMLLRRKTMVVCMFFYSDLNCK